MKNIKNIHLIGIGGIGMSGIAEIMNNLGYNITGSDQANNSNVKRLKKWHKNFFRSQIIKYFKCILSRLLIGNTSK